MGQSAEKGQTIEKNVSSSDLALGRKEACIPIGASSLGIPAALLAIIVTLSISYCLQLPPWPTALAGLTAALFGTAFFRWFTSAQVTLFEEALVLSSKLRRQVVWRKSINKSNWSRKKTFRNGMLSGNRYSLDITYTVNQRTQRTLRFHWWITNGASHAESQQLLNALGSKFTNDCSFAIRSSKHC